MNDPTARLHSHCSRLARSYAPQVAVRAPGFTYSFGDVETPYHATSVGKLATTALVLMLIDEGALRPSTPVGDIYPELAGLVDGEVTIEHLLTHTSGMNDYFEGSTISGPTVGDLAVSDVDRWWDPRDLVDHTRLHQRPVGAPEEKFFYSDTGFAVLGFILEELASLPLEQLAAQRIFEPLGMSSAFYPLRSEPSPPIAPLTIGRTRIDGTAALSMDWAGGGIAATSADFLALIHGLTHGRLVREDTWRWASAMRNRFRPGLRYGAGVMGVCFEGLVPWARRWPRLVGHLGVTAAHLWHDPVHDADIAINLGSTRAMRASFRLLYEIERILRSLD